MPGAAEILVIILSVVLAIFLILAIVLMVLLIKITRQLRTVAGTAQKAAEHINSLAVNATKLASPALIGKFVFDQLKKMRK